MAVQACQHLTESPGLDPRLENPPIEWRERAFPLGKRLLNGHALLQIGRDILDELSHRPRGNVLCEFPQAPLQRNARLGDGGQLLIEQQELVASHRRARLLGLRLFEGIDIELHFLERRGRFVRRTRLDGPFHQPAGRRQCMVLKHRHIRSLTSPWSIHIGRRL